MSSLAPLTIEELTELSVHFRLHRSYAFYDDRLHHLAMAVVCAPDKINDLVYQFIEHVHSCDCWYCLVMRDREIDFIDYYALCLFRLNGTIHAQMN